MFVTIDGIRYNILEFTAYRLISSEAHPIGIEIHYSGGTKINKYFDTEAQRDEFVEALGSTYIQLNSVYYNAMYFSAYYTEDVMLPEPSYNVIVHYEGSTKLVFKFNSESDRTDFIESKLANASFGGLVQVDSYADLPSSGSTGSMYITKDTGQTYYWDSTSRTYITVGTSGRTGVYSYSGELPTAIGSDTTINKTDLEVIVAPTVPYSEGSEVSASNAVHALIISSTTTTVTVKTITDMTIDSFRQVATLNDLPATGVSNILYAVKNIKEFRVWNSANNEYETFPVKPTGADNDQIHVTVSESNEIEAELQEESISKTHLTQELKDEIEGKQDIANIKRFKNVFAFDGVTKEFNIPNTIDVNHIDAVYVNGLILLEGAGNDYTINKTTKKITFEEAWETGDNSYVTCE